MAIGNPFQLGHTVTVGVVSYQGRPFQLEEAGGAPEGTGFRLTLDDITASMARHMRLPVGLDGALVTTVVDDSPADDAGVHAGDIVREINRRVVRNAMDARRAIADIEAGTPVFLLVWRQGNELFLQIRPN